LQNIVARKKLLNYLVTHRKRSGLTQRNIAYILDCESDSKISEYERFRRTPSLETALACEVIFGVPIRQLFAGVSDCVEKKIRRRMQLLANKLNEIEPVRPADRQRTALASAILENCRPKPERR
jgi:transcriptional regulator with XRE-family HTH domain